jgi:hypothetical protein
MVQASCWHILVCCSIPCPCPPSTSKCTGEQADTCRKDDGPECFHLEYISRWRQGHKLDETKQRDDTPEEHVENGEADRAKDGTPDCAAEKTQSKGLALIHLVIHSCANVAPHRSREDALGAAFSGTCAGGLLAGSAFCSTVIVRFDTVYCTWHPVTIILSEYSMGIRL